MSTYTLAFIQGWEWVIILLAVLLLFGAKKLPELAKGLGKGIREFKKASSGFSDELNRANYEEEMEQERRRERQIEEKENSTKSETAESPKKKTQPAESSSSDSKA